MGGKDWVSSERKKGFCFKICKYKGGEMLSLCFIEGIVLFNTFVLNISNINTVAFQFLMGNIFKYYNIS